MRKNRMIGNMVEIGQRTRILVFLALAGFAVSVCAPAVSAESVEEGPLKRNDWTISVTPYLWCLALDGELGVKGLETDVEMPFKDLLKDLNAALMVDFAVHKGRFGLFINSFYSRLSSDVDHTILEGSPLQQNMKIDTTIKMLIMSFGVGYRLGPYPLGSQENGRTPSVIVEPYFGGRWSDMDVKLNVTLDKTWSGEGDVGWVDPIIGVMTAWDLYPRWNLMLSGDVGGFGVGTDLAWSATLLAGYRFHFSPRIMGNVLFGYRALYQDFESDNGSGFKYDTYMHGPYVSVSIDFGQWYKIK